MTERYRMVYLSPDPFRGDRIAVGAILQGHKATRFVRTPHVPDRACLGGAAFDRLLRAVLDDLSQAEAAIDFEQLPLEVGPLFSLGSPCLVPDRVHDAELWIRDTMFARVMREPRSSVLPRWRAGRSFLRHMGVASLVHWKYSPSGDVGTRWHHHRSLEPVSLYVEGRRLLLLEPLMPSRPRFEKTVARVSTLFGAYSTACREDGVDADLAAFFLPGGQAEAKEEAMEQLRDWKGVEVFDGALEPQRRKLVARIREAASPLFS